MSGSVYTMMARQITVAEICTPIYTIESSNSIWDGVAEWEAWGRQNDFLVLWNQVALIRNKGKLIGYTNETDLSLFEEDHPNISLNDKISRINIPVSVNQFLSADTPLLEIVKLFKGEGDKPFFVLKGNEIIGWLSFSDLFKLPFQLCIFALLTGIEGHMLEICARNSTHIIKKIKPEIVDSWRKKFNKEEKQRAQQGNWEFKELKKEDGLSYSGNLIRNYISFSQKVEVLKKVEGLEKYIPLLAQKDRNGKEFIETAISLRNKIAHGRNSGAELLNPEELSIFLDWLSQLEEQMANFLKPFGFFKHYKGIGEA